MSPKRRVDKTHLRFKGITSRTATLYKREVNRFLRYAVAEKGSLPSQVEVLDELLGEYINELYQEGEPISHAGWLLSGFKRFAPDLRKSLVTGQQFYVNWLRDHVPFRAVPMPWSVAKMLAACACQHQTPDLGLLLLLGFSFFLRTMEMVSLSSDDIHVDPLSSSVVITLQHTKTSRNSVQSLVLHRLPKGKIWRYTPSGFRKCFRELLSSVGALPCEFSVYSIPDWWSDPCLRFHSFLGFCCHSRTVERPPHCTYLP